MTALPPGSTIGILGGGQLGRMLAMAAARLGYRTIVLEPQPDSPARQVANRQIEAAYDDANALGELAASCAAVTYEFENVPVAVAARLARSVAVFPPPRALEVAQDRVVEKTFLNAIGLETARFQSVDSLAELRSALQSFGGAGLLKTRRLGYDGKGQAAIRTADDASRAFSELGGENLVLEAFVPFTCEISAIAARGRDGTLAAYDVVENVHRDGILRTSAVPARIAPETAAAARQAAFAVLEALSYVGVIGVEMFALADGSLLVNEVAPRVHNSGHWTEAACAVSQFEQHVRAVAGLPLGDTARHADCVMENLIGEDIDRLPDLCRAPGVVVHHYGKTETRAGRKMGHFTRLLPIA